MAGKFSPMVVIQPSAPGLKKIAPYWYPYTTMAKARWLGREILEVVSTEFRDRSMEYYRYALESGVTTINGKIAKPDTIIRNGDRIENVVHRHEPPVTSTPVKITHQDKERDFIVINKPGSIPVHAAGRYFKNSLVEILKDDFGLSKVYTVNRLDRLTSGLMIIPLNAVLANELTQEFTAGSVRKEYIARCKGHFPEEEIVCEEPLLTVDRQMGLNIVHPEGKPAKTVFTLVHYDQNTDTSVVHCKPYTGRSHQIRVHLQYLGHPIANDPVYSEPKIWGENLGKGGVDLTPSEERFAPSAPSQFQIDPQNNPESLSRTTSPKHGTQTSADANANEQKVQSTTKLLPRETGHDIGMGSPVPLSAEAVSIITNLRNMKDEDEDWSRWRDVVFRTKAALNPQGVRAPTPPPQNRRKRGGAAVPKDTKSTRVPESGKTGSVSIAEQGVALPQVDCKVVPNGDSVQGMPSRSVSPEPVQLTPEEALARLKIAESPDAPCQTEGATITPQDTTQMHYCPECYLPIHPDPKPERLYIFLHALKYTTSLGSFETEMPEWAKKGWEWDR
ncbi:hypothetical protein NLI96_g9101 [Meripilus lineatus]|uniref:Pseudouridine synthase RsuA/RluA-like domain-containing protein n=1 Tax=Meripilus lineatus TaxID=2056292 RepID=A0AAD5UW41_9APHY|nr:hypothetical protein NLI96_g9101 [Physisporinus lineatus]